jgi:CNT family concentrative nucleoside transporter
MAKVLLPEKETPRTATTLELDAKSPYENMIDAAATGAADGLKLALNVGAMLLAFMALVALVNWLFAVPALLHNRGVWAEALTSIGQRPIPEGCTGDLGAHDLAVCIGQVNALDLGAHFTAWEPWTMQRFLGVLGWPIAFLMGVPVGDCEAVSALLGERVVLNEFVAYVGLSHDLASAHPMSTRAATILTYALCGFANLSSIAIQLGGIGAIAPDRRKDLAAIGFRAMIGGLLASYMTACVAGILA